MFINYLPQGSFKVVPKPVAAAPAPAAAAAPVAAPISTAAAPTASPTTMNVKSLPQGSFKVVTPAATPAAPTQASEAFPSGGAFDSFSRGIAKGEVSTVKGLSDLGNTIADQSVGRLVNLFSGRGFNPTHTSDAFERMVGGKENVDSLTVPKGTAENVGNFAEKVAEFAIPGSKISSATAKLPALAKYGLRALGSGTIAAAQSGKIGTESAIAAGTELLLPGASKLLKPVTNIAGRFIKSLASGLSGVSERAISALAENPQAAQNAIKVIDTAGQEAVLKKNANTILQGVSTVRQEARRAFGEGLQALKAEDINPTTFRTNVQESLDKFGSAMTKNGRVLENVEFAEPKNLKTASNLIDELSTVNLDGLSLRRLADKIESKVYKTATSDERLSFNAFLHDLSGTLKNAVNDSTDKLAEINKKYSTDLQLTNAIEGIFGKVKFKSLNELRGVAQKLETLFNHSGLSPEITENFLKRIGVNPSEFRASEAARQITNVTQKSNAEGLSLGELIRSVTSSIVTPKMIRDITVKTGMTEDALVPFLQKLAPATKAAFIQSMIGPKKKQSHAR